MSGIYRAGTVTVTAATDQVVGVGTLFVANVKAGDVFKPDNNTRDGIVESIEDDTHLTLVTTFSGGVTAGTAFTILQTSHDWNPVTDLAATAAAIFAIINGPGFVAHPAATDNPHATTMVQAAEAMGLAPAANKIFRFTSGSAGTLDDITIFGRSVIAAVGALPGSASVNVASGAAPDIGAADSNYVRLTGSVTTPGFATAVAGVWRWVRCAVAPLFPYNATSMILPGSVDFQAAAGDILLFVSEGSGNWRCLLIARADGKAVVGPALADITDAHANARLLMAENYAGMRGLLSLGSAALKDIVVPTAFTVDVEFATNGDFNSLSVTEDGRYWKVGDFLFFWLSVAFNTNAYSGTVGGAFRVTGLPSVAASGPNSVTIGQCSMVKFNLGEHLSAQVLTGENYVRLYLNKSEASRVLVGKTQFPASVSGYLLEMSGFYPI